MSMKVPACYRSFGLKSLSMENMALTDETSTNEKGMDKNAVSFKESISRPRNQKKNRKYKAPTLSVRG
ncbi:hypothetical protein Desde_0726 [Desulfitobacterium dehalogenans ATCC 51507]|uniref:Uncharacterized protein n=2 Tax=Desulfitobacterium dehalogenans TaxID=36854 RepID=I4A5D9_DESDJ|nr:hypothetical protein [Desulfitobacterium dehalogenans]AFL99173.1 hypothetical protein Desde_0726 [Desulfitobacterium dehalogenans ATCC 51507]